MSTITTILAGDLITNSRADINNNFSNLNTDKMETSVLDTDTALTANSDSKVATQKAVKTYVDAGGNVNASETSKGIVEEATDAETLAGTATGGTGAKLVVTPAKLKAVTSPVVRTYLNAASPATWSKPTGLKYVIVEVQGAGGSGGGVNAGSSPGTASSGGGGGAYGKKLIVAASLGGTETVTIGIGGSAPSAGDNNGTAGATSSFGAHVSCTGGGAGQKGTVNTVASGGTSTGGDINISGQDSTAGVANSLGSQGGNGGSSVLGFGGTSSGITKTQAGQGYGAGGAGVHNVSTTSAGGAGADGFVIVTEYYL